MTFLLCLFDPFIPFYSDGDELGVYLCFPPTLSILERGLITDSVLNSQYTRAMLCREALINSSCVKEQNEQSMREAHERELHTAERNVEESACVGRDWVCLRLLITWHSARG